jgi:hypothetical protein
MTVVLRLADADDHVVVEADDEPGDMLSETGLGKAHFGIEEADIFENVSDTRLDATVTIIGVRSC